MPTMQLHAGLRQQQALSPKLQQAVRLLQLSSLDFAQCVKQALGRNPFLESLDGDDEPGAAGCGDDSEASDAFDAFNAETPSAAAAGTSAEGVLADPADAADPADHATHAEHEDREVWQADGAAARESHDTQGLSALDRMACEPTLAAHLQAQLALQPMPRRDLLLACLITDSLDDDGYLRSSLDELALLAQAELPAQPTQPPQPASPTEMALALQRVQALEPAGVGARDVAECLRLQLPAIDCEQLRALAESIIDEHLAQLAAHDVAALARALHCTPERIEQVCDRIRHLDPHPGWRFGASSVQYVNPDVIARKVRGVWSVLLNPAAVPRVRLNEVYARMYQRSAGEQNSAMASHLQEARWTVRNVEKRFCTIVEVARVIVQRQKHFLEYGPMAMKPLGLREIADELGMHESTVSRVTNGKYLATPLGVFELKYFFSRGMATASGGACTGTAIRGLIKDMIDVEQPNAPLSDAEIARQLARQGLTVARRTVTKYRQGLRIEAVDRRRRYGTAVAA